MGSVKDDDDYINADVIWKNMPLERPIKR